MTVLQAHPLQVPGRRFHLAMAMVMLGLVILGFARTFFLRPFFDTYYVPWYALGHGVIMTAWFVWYVLQTALVTKGRVDLHRRLGLLGVGIGTLAILSAIATGLGTVVRNRLAGRDIEAELDHFADVVWSNTSSIIVFAGFFALAIALRRRPQAHKRLMLLATMSLLGPALSRVWVLPPVEVWSGMELNTLVFPIGGMVALPAALVMHDLAARCRPHPVTLVGIPLLFGSLASFSAVVPTTEFGRAIIRLFV